MNAALMMEPLRAGLGDYLPLLVFVVIWWVSSRMGRKKTSISSGGAVGQNGEEVNPLDVLRQMLSGGLRTTPEAPVDADYADNLRELPGWPEREPLPSAIAEMVVLPPSVPKEVTAVTARKASSAVATRLKPEGTALVQARISLRELQRAVVWSELLAPPVGLRDGSR